MANPFIHALVFTAAVLIPGGLLVYFAWRAISLKAKANQSSDSEPYEDISEVSPDPEEARKAFEQMFPIYPPDSLGAQTGMRRLRLYKSRPRKKS
jgi:hypothetical protein